MTAAVVVTERRSLRATWCTRCCVPRSSEAAHGHGIHRRRLHDPFHDRHERLLGRYMCRVFTGKRTFLDPVLVPIERLVLRLTGVDPVEQQDWKRYSVSLLISNVVHVAGDVDDRHAPAVPAAQSRWHRQHGADARVQHDLELHDEHQPAALQRGDGPLVLLADVRHHVPAVRDRGDGRRGGGGDHPRAWPATG